MEAFKGILYCELSIPSTRVTMAISKKMAHMMALSGAFADPADPYDTTVSLNNSIYDRHLSPEIANEFRQFTKGKITVIDNSNPRHHHPKNIRDRLRKRLAEKEQKGDS